MNQMKSAGILALLLFAFVALSFIAHQNNSTKDELPDQKMIRKDTMMTQHYIRSVDRYLDGLTNKDLQGILDLYAQNATVEDPVGSKIISGYEAIRKFYSGAVTMDLELKRTGPVRVAANEAAFSVRVAHEGGWQNDYHKYHRCFPL